jgi:hypothetical protein
MKHLVLSLVLLGAGLTPKQDVPKPGEAPGAAANRLNQFLVCCGGPVCLPGDPCGPGNKARWR